MSQDTDLLTRLGREAEHWRNLAEERQIEIEKLRRQLEEHQAVIAAAMKRAKAGTE
jgi:hypothetical protein